MQLMEVSVDEKKIFMQFLIDYLNIETGEAYWQDIPDDFFVLMKKLVESDTDDEQAKVIQQVATYVKDFHKSTKQAVHDFNRAKIKLEGVLEHEEKESTADKMLEDIDEIR